MKFFDCKALEFLKDLKKNNTKEWFLDHKNEYEKFILEPSKSFVEEFGEELLALDPHIKAIPKVNASLFRIYRDIRLSKDKTPMKSKIGIIFWRGGGTRLQSSSFYLHFSPDEFLVASGIRGFSKEALLAYREYIKDKKRAKELFDIMNTLQSKGFLFPSPKYKRYPQGFKKGDDYSSLSLYASMYAYKILDPKEICSNELDRKLFDIYQELMPLFGWIYDLSLTFDFKSAKQKSLSLK